MKKSWGELMSEIVGPAGSTIVGAFSWRGCDEEPCWLLEDWLGDWDVADCTLPAMRRQTAAGRAITTLQKWRNDMKKNLA